MCPASQPHILCWTRCAKPLITADLHLGEGTGAVASLPLWDMALAVYNHCYSFSEGGIAPYTRNADAGHRWCGQRQSAFAESLCLRAPLPRTYLATMQVWDAECAARVAKHRAMRAEKQFDTVECPLHLDRVALPRRGTVLLEDLGNLAANELYDPDGAGTETAAVILQGIDKMLLQCDNLIVVSNEVFSGGADYAGDTDRYLRTLAAVNNAAAARADAVVRVVCGIPVYYKGSEGP